jgi:hypothetical protein
MLEKRMRNLYPPSCVIPSSSGMGLLIGTNYDNVSILATDVSSTKESTYPAFLLIKVFHDRNFGVKNTSI